MAGDVSPAREVLVTRAEPGATQTARRLLDRAYAPVVAPLLRVAVRPAALDLEGVQAVLFSSPNGARAWADLRGRTDLKALCVGEGTAQAARGAGFADIAAANGDAGSLASLALSALDPAAGPVAWASGEDISQDIAALLRPRGFDVRRIVVYRAEMAARLPDAAERAFRGETLAAVLFHSARAAEAFVRLAAEADLAGRAGRLTAVCMSARVAGAAGALAWRAVVAADGPDEASLLAALDRALHVEGA